jgi:hypothetical protein
MFAVLGKIFGSSKSVGKMVDAGIEAIDKLKLTDEESLDARVSLLGLAGDFMVKSSGQDMARRGLAFVVALPWGLAALIAIAMTVMGRDTGPILDLMENAVNRPFMIVMGFYFLPHLISAAMKPRK